MLTIVKQTRWRNPALLDHARHMEHCAFCGGYAPRKIVAAHSNQSKHGKALGVKAHDCFIAFLCDVCHGMVDAERTSYETAIAIWTEGHVASIPHMKPFLDAQAKRLMEEADEA